MLGLRIHRRDFLLIPVLVTLCRIPLALVFPMTLGNPTLALFVLGLAGLSDLLDGYLARRLKQESDLGAIADGFADKLFVLVVAVSMWQGGFFPLWQVLLLGTRDAGEVLVVDRAYVAKSALPAQASRANKLGKITTLFQFAAVALALFHIPFSLVFVFLAAGFGVAAALSYLRRVPVGATR